MDGRASASGYSLDSRVSPPLSVLSPYQLSAKFSLISGLCFLAFLMNLTYPPPDLAGSIFIKDVTLYPKSGIERGSGRRAEVEKRPTVPLPLDYSENPAHLSDKAIDCVGKSPMDNFAIRQCIIAASKPYIGRTMTWKGKVTSPRMLDGVTASGYGFFAVIADDPQRRAMFIEFKRGTPAFVKMMKQEGFGPRLYKFFDAKGTFAGFIPALPQWCGGNPNCFVPKLDVSEPSDFDLSLY